MTSPSSPQTFDLDRWPDLAAELDRAGLDEFEAQLLAWHVAEQLVGWFGVEQFEAYRGKEGQQIFSTDEVAAAIVAKLASVWTRLPAGSVESMWRSGELAQPLTHPWDKTD